MAEKADLAANPSGLKKEQKMKRQKRRTFQYRNRIYYKMIFPAANSITYLIYSLAAFIILPVLYLGGETGTRICALIAYGLIFAVIIVLQKVEICIRKNTHKKRTWTELLEKFSNDTYALSYMLTSVEYIIVLLDGPIFWYIYVIMLLGFWLAFWFDIIVPLKGKAENNEKGSVYPER